MSDDVAQAGTDDGLDPRVNDPAQRGLYYANALDFMDHYMLPSYPRVVGGDVAWCEHWWKHGEALARIDALWRSFEAHRVHDNASSMAVWWRDFADPTMSALTRPDGVFAKCTGRPGYAEHVDDHDRMLRTTTPPEGMFTDERKIGPQEYAQYVE